MSDLDDIHALRPVTALLRLMEGVALECEVAGDSSGSAHLFRYALRLAHEIRVPRMPDDEATLRRMLDEARQGPFLTTEQVFENIRLAREKATRLRSLYDDHVTSGRLVDAARMLCPGPGSMLSWNRHMTVEEKCGHDSYVARCVCDRAVVECRSSCKGHAVLGAVMRMHAWKDAWSR